MDRIAAVYRARDVQELTAQYDNWAPHYDRQIEYELGYAGPRRGASALADHVPRTARILDAGAGTGLVGQALFDLGYHNITGIDVSSGMLAHARAKQVYTSFHRMDLNGRLAIKNESFDAVISVGVLTDGHAPPACLDEFVRVCVPGGHIVMSLRCDRGGCYRDAIAALQSRGSCRVAAVSDPFDCFVNSETRIALEIWTCVVESRADAVAR
jgi:predicted TPR repeat methyltransferase